MPQPLTTAAPGAPSEDVAFWALEALRHDVQDLYYDPEGYGTDEEVTAHHETLARAAKWLGEDFEATVIEYTTVIERQRMARILEV